MDYFPLFPHVSFEIINTKSWDPMDHGTQPTGVPEPKKATEKPKKGGELATNPK